MYEHPFDRGFAEAAGLTKALAASNAAEKKIRGAFLIAKDGSTQAHASRGIFSGNTGCRQRGDSHLRTQEGPLASREGPGRRRAYSESRDGAAKIDFEQLQKR